MKKYIPKTFLENFGLGLTIAYSVIWPLNMGITLTQVAVIQSCMFVASILIFLSVANLFRNIQLAITGPIIIFFVANIGIFTSMTVLFAVKITSVMILHKQQNKIVTDDLSNIG